MIFFVFYHLYNGYGNTGKRIGSDRVNQEPRVLISHTLIDDLKNNANQSDVQRQKHVTA